MKRFARVCLLSTISAISLMNPVSAQELVNESKEVAVAEQVKEFTMDTMKYQDAEAFILKHLKSKGLNYQVGSSEYNTFIEDLYLNKNKEISKSKYFNYLQVYAAEYINQISLQETRPNNDSGIETIKNLSIQNLIEKAQREEATLLQAYKTEMDASSAAIASTYNGTAAANYALAWAENGNKKRNPYYNTGWTNDCTNFASQAVYAGGKAMNKPSPLPNGVTESTSRWYSERIMEPEAYYWKESTSWIRVVDFYSYWSSRAASVKDYAPSAIAQLKADAVVGDIIQLAPSTGGARTHSMVVTKKENGKVFVTYHTGIGGYDVVNNSIDGLTNRFTLIHF